MPMQDIYVDFDIDVHTGYGINADNADQHWFVTGNIATSGSAAIHAAGNYSRFDLDNTFTVAGGAPAVELIGFNLELNNSGTIDGAVGVAVSGNTVTINNNGKISGGAKAGIMLETSPANTTFINNFGDIIGKPAILTAAGKLHLLNRGHIYGDVKLGSGADLVESPETIVGDVHLGRGADSFDATGGFLAGTVRGGRGDDVLVGGLSRDRLAGGRGDDVLDGGGATRDILEGGKGANTFVFAAFHAVDRVKDFDVGADRIRIDATLLTGIEAGPLGAAAFVVGSKAADADDRVIYDDRTGILKYDANGDLAGGVVKIAKLAPQLDLSHHHFDIV